MSLPGFTFARRTRKPLYVLPDADLRPRWKRTVANTAPNNDSDDQSSDVDDSFESDSSSDDDAAWEPDSEEAFWSTGLDTVSKLTRPAVDVFDDVLTQQQIKSSSKSAPDLREGYIRLLWIEVGSSDSDIHCTTRVFPINGRPSYNAISYTWGSPIALDNRYKITLDGQTQLLPKNLWRFLEQASKRQSGWLWIDALSIDQHCPEERTHQVGMMSAIFSDARRVVVWLGPAYERSDEAMRALSRPSRLHLPATLGDPDTTKAIEALFVRPYWVRLWIYQELKSARKLAVMCGNAILDWVALETYVHDLYMDYDVQDLFDTPAVRMILLRTRSIGTSLWHMLEATKHLRCADQRDRVYALLSVATTGHEGICADYTVQVADLIYSVLDNMCKNNGPKDEGEAIARCLDIAEVFRADLTSLSRLEQLLKDHMRIPEFVPLTPKPFVEWLGDAHRKRLRMRLDSPI